VGRAGVMLGAPHLISFFRDPVDRCASSWHYEMKLCLGPFAYDVMHADFCSMFRAKYAVTAAEPETQMAYAERSCSEHMSDDLAEGDVDGMRLLELPAAQVEGARAGGPSGSLLNAGMDCWVQCSNRQGFCLSLYCGMGGACCKQGFLGSPAACGSGTLGCNEKHCCVAAVPNPPSAPRLSFFGMAEAYDVSVCLLWFQTGMLTAEAWGSSLCVCSKRAELHQMLAGYDSEFTKTRGHEARGNQPLVIPFNVSRQAVEALNKGDVAFYRVAWREFERRVRAVEEVVKHTFMHCD